MKKFIAAGLLLMSFSAYSQLMAHWTGKSRGVVSVTGIAGFNCEYRYGGDTFWVFQEGFCRASIPIR